LAICRRCDAGSAGASHPATRGCLQRFTSIALASGSQAADKQGYANYSYSQSYNYDFRNSSVVNCIANATKVLTQFGLDKKINTNASEDGKFASVWGWSEEHENDRRNRMQRHGERVQPCLRLLHGQLRQRLPIL